MKNPPKWKIKNWFALHYSLTMVNSNYSIKNIFVWREMLFLRLIRYNDAIKRSKEKICVCTPDLSAMQDIGSWAVKGRKCGQETAGKLVHSGLYRILSCKMTSFFCLNTFQLYWLKYCSWHLISWSRFIFTKNYKKTLIEPAQSLLLKYNYIHRILLFAKEL